MMTKKESKRTCKQQLGIKSAYLQSIKILIQYQQIHNILRSSTFYISRKFNDTISNINIDDDEMDSD